MNPVLSRNALKKIGYDVNVISWLQTLDYLFFIFHSQRGFRFNSTELDASMKFLFE